MKAFSKSIYSFVVVGFNAHSNSINREVSFLNIFVLKPEIIKRALLESWFLLDAVQESFADQLLTT